MSRTVIFPMKRSLTRLGVVALASAGLSVSVARASDVHFGVSLAIPFEHGEIGITVGNGPGYYGRGPYYGGGPRYHGHHHGYRYALPPYGACAPWLPSSYAGVVINGAAYSHNGAVYYQYTPGGYPYGPAPVATIASAPGVAVPAPAPAPVIAAPPPAQTPVVYLPKSTDMSGALQLRFRGKTYFYQSGLFFKKTSTGYVSTAAPVGAVAQRLPGDAEAMMLGDQEYFASGSTVFKQTRDGFMLLDG